jgi:signal transduction histidine kinase
MKMTSFLSKYLGLPSFVLSAGLDHNLVSAEERQYRHDFLLILFQWTRVVALVMAGGLLLAFLYNPIITTFTLFIALFGLFVVIWWCLSLLSQGHLQSASRLWLVSATTVVGIYMLFMPTAHILVGMIGLILFVRITAATETTRATLLLGAVATTLYLVISFLRFQFQLPEIDLGAMGVALRYLIPIVVIVIITLLDRTSTQYLKEALIRSETARAELAGSYTELEAQKEALEQSEANLSTLAAKLERSNRDLQTTNVELKAFAYIISHDLRAPLINLKGFANELSYSLKAIQGGVEATMNHLPEEQQQSMRYVFEEDIPEALGFIEASVMRMDHFINTLLKLSRLGRRELRFEKVDMVAVVQRICKTLAHQIDQAGIQINVDLLPTVVADLTSIEQIMGNILTNAVQYLDPQRPGQIDITATETSGETIFQIRDNGYGIAEDDMHKVFEPFRRAGLQKVAGEGMGLAYVQTMVRRHGGRIWCQSKLGEGTTFNFSLPKIPYNGDIHA